jgi:hypothetical protein
VGRCERIERLCAVVISGGVDFSWKVVEFLASQMPPKTMGGRNLSSLCLIS